MSTEWQMMDALRGLAEGYDTAMRPVAVDVQMRAVQLYNEIYRNKQLAQNDTSRAENDKLRAQADMVRAEADQLRAENDRLRAEAEVLVAKHRLRFESEQLQIGRATVVVQALEVAVKGGADPQQVLGVVQNLATMLLSVQEEQKRLVQHEQRLMLEDQEAKQTQAEAKRIEAERNMPYWERRRLKKKRNGAPP